MANKKGGNTGKRGKSNVTHINQGTFRSDRHGDKARMISFDAELKDSDCPDGLKEVEGAVEIWNEVCQLMAGKMVLFHNSKYQLEIYCARMAMFRTMRYITTTAEMNSLRILAQSFGLDMMSQDKLQSRKAPDGSSRFRRRSGSDEG